MDFQALKCVIPLLQGRVKVDSLKTGLLVCCWQCCSCCSK